jgi:hypothetical protein
MGILADLFIATEDEVRVLAPDGIPSEHFQTLELAGLTEIELGALNAQLRGLEFEDAMDDLISFWAVDEVNGPWIVKFDDAFTGALAALPDESLAGHARAWATIEELEHWDQRDVLERLEGIVKLAREAIRDQKIVFLWNSL